MGRMIEMCEFEVPMVGAQQGWQCPVCKRVYAPFVSECLYCGRNTVTNIGTGTGDNPVVDWYKIYAGTGMPKVTLNNTSIGSMTTAEEMDKLGLAGWPQAGEDKDD